MKFMKEHLIFIMFLLLCLVFYFKFATATVSGSSMYPNFEEEDLLLIYKTTNINYGDVVIIWSDELHKELCKRVLGKAGDVIKIVNGTVYRNGVIVEEPYIQTEWGEGYVKEVTVEDDQIFVLGDNRNASTDSRSLENLKVSDLYGRVIFNFTNTLNLSYDCIIAIVAVLWGILIFDFLAIKRSKSKQEQFEDPM